MSNDFLEKFLTHDDTVLTFEEMWEKYDGKMIVLLNVTCAADGTPPPCAVYAACDPIDSLNVIDALIDTGLQYEYIKIGDNWKLSI